MLSGVSTEDQGWRIIRETPGTGDHFAKCGENKAIEGVRGNDGWRSRGVKEHDTESAGGERATHLNLAAARCRNAAATESGSVSTSVRIP